MTEWNARKGRWFSCLGPIVVPLSKEKALEEVENCEFARNKVPLSQLHWVKGRKLRLSVQRGVTAARRLLAVYNNQPEWRLRELRAQSRDEAREIVTEFLDLVSFASSNYGWQWEDPSEHEDWKRHAWKHTDFEMLESVVRDGWMVEIEYLKRATEMEDLCRRAIEKDPAATARLDVLFSDEKEKREVFKRFLAASEQPRFLPSSSELASDLVDIVQRSPDSQVAEKARRDLRVLVSKKAIKGAASKGGRPPIQYTSALVSHVFKMSYALAKQVREVDRFLKAHQGSTKARVDLLQKFYPWLTGIPTSRLTTLLGSGPVDVACHIAGRALEISPSKVEKIAYRKSPN